MILVDNSFKKTLGMCDIEYTEILFSSLDINKFERGVKWKDEIAVVL